MTAFALLFTLASMGISETVYLIRKRIAAEKPICPIGEDCAMVLSSKYNKTLSVHNDLLGFLAYIVIAIIAAFLVIEVAPIELWSLILKLLVGLASLASAYFTFLQWKIIRAWCFWCLMSAFTIWLMEVIILVDLIN